jgi:hypothetical protein
MNKKHLKVIEERLKQKNFIKNKENLSKEQKKIIKMIKVIERKNNR